VFTLIEEPKGEELRFHFSCHAQGLPFHILPLLINEELNIPLLYV